MILPSYISVHNECEPSDILRQKVLHTCIAKRMKGQLTPIAIPSNYPVAGRIQEILPIGGTAVQTLAHATVNLQIL